MTLADKKEFTAINYLRLFLAVLVVILHVNPFVPIHIKFAYWLQHVLTVIAVPTFFIISGYFLKDKLYNKEKTMKTVRNLMKIVAICYLLYLPIIIHGFITEYIPDSDLISGVVTLLFDLFLRGQLYTAIWPFWYLVALIFTYLIMNWLLEDQKVKIESITKVGIGLYLSGALITAVNEMALNIPIITTIVDAYCNIFLDTKNFLFFGIPFVSLGQMIYKNREKIKFEWKWIIGLIISFILMNIESYFCLGKGYNISHSLISFLIFTPLLVICVMMIPMDNEKHKTASSFCKDASLTIFLAHSFFYSFSDLFIDGFDFLPKFMATFIPSLVLAIILFLWKQKKFQKQLGG